MNKGNKLMNRFLLTAFSFLVFGFINFARAEMFGIAAVVNDEVVSIADLENRMILVLGTSGIPVNDETKRRFTPQILQGLIDDVLKIQEAKRLGIEINDDDIMRAIGVIEKNNGLPSGGLRNVMNSLRLSLDVLKAQVRGEIAWLRIIQQQITPKISITDEEVKLQLERKKALADKPEMLVSEIFFPVDTIEKDSEIRTAAERIVEHLKNGSDFAAAARQFSASPTAAKGGDLEWVFEGQLDSKLEAALNSMQVGEISNPIRTRYGYYILFLRNKRISSNSDDNVEFSLAQIFFPNSMKKDEKTAKIKEASALKSCPAFIENATKMETEGSGDLGTIKAKDIPAQLLPIIRSLSLQTPSKPIAISGGELVIMVCNKKSPEGYLDEEVIRNHLELERMDVLARQRLREMRRAAIIEIRN